MKNIDMKITEEIAVLSVSGSGYTKEINLVSWNGAEPKHYLYLDEAEWRRLVFYLNEFRNKLIAQGRYTDCVDELLVKTVSAKTVKIR